GDGRRSKPETRRSTRTAGPRSTPRVFAASRSARYRRISPTGGDATVPPVHDLAVIVVSHDQGRWLARCLPSLREHAEGLDLDVVVVDNGPSGDVGELEGARVLRTENRGFAAANNAGLAEIDARWVLFLNPDTELLEGSLADLLDAREDVGGVGVPQVEATGELTRTMRRFPSGSRALGDALGLERLPGRPDWLGERELRLDRYDREFEGDWTIGSFLLARREALDRVGGFDER